jgi:hypothetical protein
LGLAVVFGGGVVVVFGGGAVVVVVAGGGVVVVVPEPPLDDPDPAAEPVPVVDDPVPEPADDPSCDSSSSSSSWMASSCPALLYADADALELVADDEGDDWRPFHQNQAIAAARITPPEMSAVRGFMPRIFFSPAAGAGLAIPGRPAGQGGP